MKKITLISILMILCASINAQEKKYINIYAGKAELEFAEKSGVEPLTEKERKGFDFFCEKISTPLLCIPLAKVDNARRLIVYVVKLSNINYDFLAKYILECSENIHKGLNSCICVDIDSTKVIDNYTMSVELLGEAIK